MKKNILIALSITFSFLTKVAADEISIRIPQSKCSAVDVRDKNPELKDHFSRPRDQDSIGWCYGFAAADLMSVEAGEPVSASHTSMIYNEKVENSTFLKLGYDIAALFSKNDQFKDVYEGGFVKKAIKATRDKGSVCTEEDMPFDGTHNRSTKEMITRLEKIKRDISKKNLSIDKVCKEIGKFLNKTPEIKLETMELYFILEDNNINEALTLIVEKQCGKNQLKLQNYKVKNKHRPTYKVRSRESEKRANERFSRNINKYFDLLNSKLDSGKPLAISYNVKHVTNFSGGHASVVTARRWKNGVCEYKVRNSWGRGCGAYSQSKIRDCDAEEGSFWVTGEKFYEMVDTLTYIRGK